MADIHFGTDGWRAIIGEDFTPDNLNRVVAAAARIFKEEAVAAGRDPPMPRVRSSSAMIAARMPTPMPSWRPQVAAGEGFNVLLTEDYCPTPTLCWSVAHNDDAVGGIMLTSSHNPAEYLGVKLRMADGGASPAEFTDRVEAVLPPEPTDILGPFQTADLMTDYLAALRELVDVEAIRGANLRVVCDPLYGAGRHYLADLLRDMGVEVVEIHNAEDPTFAGLHPEPIQPWVDEGLTKVGELGYDALFINDGDADRIAAGDSRGNYVNAHRIITLLTKHMVDRGETGRVVSTVTASAMLDRMCRKLGLELVSTPVGFKWIYGEMEKGGVMIGGEESGGIGLPDHVKERDGLLMALLLTECMAQSGKDLGAIIDEMLADIGRLEFARRGLSITDEQMARFRAETVPAYTADEIAGKRVLDVDRRDGVKLLLEGDAWVMMRPSGTEPLVRIYAEAATTDEVNELLDAAEAVVTSL